MIEQEHPPYEFKIYFFPIERSLTISKEVENAMIDDLNKGLSKFEAQIMSMKLITDNGKQKTPSARI